MNVCIYLRKSRADEELEKEIGQGETLTKHRKALLKYAKEHELNIVDIKEEIVSGESLFHRPKMLELLKEVEAKSYDGVLVMDIQRLGRGDMQDQGIILKTFKDSHTKIITPQKTYDLDNDFDEEYTEFEAFMSRKELKMINRRMQGGRIRSVEDGNYIATNPPLGYDITFIGKSRTLKPNDKADLVRMIFDMYANQDKGLGTIATELNSLGFTSAEGRPFDRTSISFILHNLCYIGKVTWKKREYKKSKEPYKIKDCRTRDKSEWIVADGKHEPIVSEELFNKAQEVIDKRYHIPYHIVNGPKNPLAGIIVCKTCGRKMHMRPIPDKEPRLICDGKCGNVSTRYDWVERDLLNALEDYLSNFSIEVENNEKKNNIKLYTKQINSLNKELDTLKSQKLKLFDLLEQNIYNTETFVERSNYISERENEINTTIDSLSLLMNQEKHSSDKTEYMNKVKKVLHAYKTLKDVKKKNLLMKSILEKVVYYKSPDQKGDNFTIEIVPRL